MLGVPITGENGSRSREATLPAVRRPC
jgi:hypothetical protein